MIHLVGKIALTAIAFALVAERPALGGLMVSSDSRSAHVSGSARASLSGEVTDSYAHGNDSLTPFAEFRPSFSGSAGGSGGTAHGNSSVAQDSQVTSDSALYTSQLDVAAHRGFMSPSSECRAAADSSFHLTFSVPSELLYSLAFELNFFGYGSYPFSIPITWSYSFSSANRGVIGSRTITSGENLAGPRGVDPGYLQFTYAGTLDPADVYAIDFFQRIEAQAISDDTNARLSSALTLTTIPEPSSGAFWGISLLGLFGSVRRRSVRSAGSLRS